MMKKNYPQKSKKKNFSTDKQDKKTKKLFGFKNKTKVYLSKVHCWQR